MSSLKHTGEKSYEVTQFEWEITDFFLNSVAESNDYLESGVFAFSRSAWKLRLIQRSTRIHLYLEHATVYEELEAGYEIGLKKADGSVEQFFTGKILDFSMHAWPVAGTSMSELVKRKDVLAPPNGLTILCILRRGTAQQLVLNQAPPMKFKELDMLSENFKSLSVNEGSCDVILKVKEKEFPAHKAILMARSSVFADMFNHDTAEKRTGIIDIPDCDPDSFHEFLHYLYCGKLQDISFHSAFHLYKTADKYNVQELKPYCVEYMKHCLTEDNVCDVVLLAELNDQTKLMDAAQDFFNENVSKIVATTAWKSLLETNYPLANKLITEMVSTKK